MFRNRFWGGLLGLFLVLLLVGTVGVFAYQMGAASGAGIGLAAGEAGTRVVYPAFGFFPFFWGFGLIKFFFLFFFGMLILRLIFRPWRMMGRGGGHWKEGRGHWRDRLKEVHDEWHAEHPDEEHGSEPAA